MLMQIIWRVCSRMNMEESAQSSWCRHALAFIWSIRQAPFYPTTRNRFGMKVQCHHCTNISSNGINGQLPRCNQSTGKLMVVQWRNKFTGECITPKWFTISFQPRVCGISMMQDAESARVVQKSQKTEITYCAAHPPVGTSGGIHSWQSYTHFALPTIRTRH